MRWWHSKDIQWKQTIAYTFCERFKWQGHCGCQVHCPKWKILVFPLAVPRSSSCASCCKWLHSVKLIMTDGDSQEMSQVDLFAISTYFVNAVHTQCGWHLVDQGWRQNCKGLD
jgi:hypothetical protein